MGERRLENVKAHEAAEVLVVPQHVPSHPGSSSALVSDRMSKARRKDTAPEMTLRRELHRRGFRYRVSYPVPGNRRRTIDIAFTKARVAVFVDGCFWHGCPEHGTRPRSSSTWWERKLAANVARDSDTTRVLSELGWRVIRVWEHDLFAHTADKIEECLRRKRVAQSEE